MPAFGERGDQAQGEKSFAAVTGQTGDCGTRKRNQATGFRKAQGLRVSPPLTSGIAWSCDGYRERWCSRPCAYPVNSTPTASKNFSQPMRSMNSPMRSCLRALFAQYSTTRLMIATVSGQRGGLLGQEGHQQLRKRRALAGVGHFAADPQGNAVAFAVLNEQAGAHGVAVTRNTCSALRSPTPTSLSDSA